MNQHTSALFMAVGQGKPFKKPVQPLASLVPGTVVIVHYVAKYLGETASIGWEVQVPCTTLGSKCIMHGYLSFCHFSLWHLIVIVAHLTYQFSC